MGTFQNTILFSAVLLGVSHLVLAQLRNTAPETIRSCYQNITARNRATRQPMHIDNLVAIIRKLEKKSDGLWDIRRLSRAIVNRFQFDGMSHDPDKGIELEYSPASEEVIKTQILQEMIPSDDIIPEGWLDNDERCALHWMLSHSLNATRRDDEAFERYGRYSDGLRAKRATIIPETRRPVETGVIYTKWGDISAGRVIGGIAAALMEQEIRVEYKPSITGLGGGTGTGTGTRGTGTGGNYPANPSFGGNNPQSPGNDNSYNNKPWGRKKRQTQMIFSNLKNVHAATLAGDVGQAAIYNAQFQVTESRALPDGTWNDTICPREFVLNSLPDPMADGHHEHDTWTYLTASEVRGGMDGLILASKIVDLDRQGFKLSQILEMYYSEQGIPITGESAFKSCERQSLYSGRVDTNVLREQARSFAYHYNSKVLEIAIDDQNPSVFENLVSKALQKLNQFNGNTIPCDSRLPSSSAGTVEIPDRDKIIKPLGTFYAILDYSGTPAELLAQQRLLAKMAFELNVSPTGSRLGLVDGRTGMTLISPNFTDNAAILSCRILGERQYTAVTNLPQVLTTLKTELKRVREEEERLSYNQGVGNGIVVLVFVQGKKLEESQRIDIIKVLQEYSNEFGDTRVVYTSSKFQAADFEKFALSKDDFIPITQQGSGNLSDSSNLFLKELLQKSHGKLFYPRCDSSKYPETVDELKQGFDIFVDPNTIRYYAISPDYFYRSIDLRLRFTSDNGKVRICYSRSPDYKFPSKENDENNGHVECRETTGTYEAPGSSKYDIEFTITKACSGQKRGGCRPIYLSITPTTFPPAGSVGLDCSMFGCTSPDQVKVTWTHYGMKCGAFKMAVSGPAVLLTAILSILYKYNIL